MKKTFLYSSLALLLSSKLFAQTTVTLMDPMINNGSFETLDPSDAPLGDAASPRRASTSAAAFLVGSESPLAQGGWEITGSSSFHGVDTSSVGDPNPPAGSGGQDGNSVAIANQNATNTLVSGPIPQAIAIGDTFVVSFYHATNADGNGYDYTLSLRFNGDASTDLQLLAGRGGENSSGVIEPDVWHFAESASVASTVAASTVQVIVSMDNTTGGSADQVYLDTITLTAITSGIDPNGDADGDGLTNMEEDMGLRNPWQGNETPGSPPGGLPPGEPTDFAVADTDGDGLDDGVELDNMAGGNVITNPNSDDTDGDGIGDNDEIDATIGSEFVTIPTNPDTDGDGLLDGFETDNVLNPTDDGNGDPVNGPMGDPDMDGLNNLGEQTAGTDPRNNDTDGDGLTDGAEVNGARSSDPTLADTDGDGLDDRVEVEETMTDPRLTDTDDDGLDDQYEVDNMLDPNVDSAELDPDMDGLSNIDELDEMTDPQVADTDGDGLNDGDEIFGSLNPYRSGIDEMMLGTDHDATDPLDPDSDNDGLEDGSEIGSGIPLDESTDPNNSDTDDDGLPDGWERDNGLDPLDFSDDNGPDGDPDGDDVLNFDEFLEGTAANNADTDGDGLDDGFELNFDGVDPISNPLLSDSDGDGLDDRVEVEETMTLPLEIDSDGDGFFDFTEIEEGSDPNLLMDVPNGGAVLMSSTLNNGSFEMIDPHNAPLVNDNGRRAGNNATFRVGGPMDDSPGTWAITTASGFGGIDIANALGDAIEGIVVMLSNDGSTTTSVSAPIARDITPGDLIELAVLTGGNSDTTNWDFTFSLRFDGDPNSDVVILTGTDESVRVFSERTARYFSTRSASTVQIVVLQDNSNGGGDQVYLDNIRVNTIIREPAILPEVTDISFDGTMLSLTFDSVPDAVYTLMSSGDLADFSRVIRSDIESEGESTTVSINWAEENGNSVPERSFFRLSENP